ncbi:MAG: arginase family protein [Nitrospirae bacterium]|nr:arginase family protein [Nitrospirota bacterium]
MADRVNLRAYEEKIRYYADFRDMNNLTAEVKELMDNHRAFFVGSGDFHHVSYMLIKNTHQADLNVIVFDNHPDNMFFPFGIHCGSWVYHASRLPNVSSVAVFGITSDDIAGINVIQNMFSVIRAGKVRYFCLRPVGKMMRYMGGINIEAITAPGIKITDVFDKYIKHNHHGPVYLSIDKDVLEPGVVGTTWDQGRMSKEDLLQCIRSIAPRIACADICGDLSIYQYRDVIKRFMRRFDGTERTLRSLDIENERHIKLNRDLLSSITGNGM